MLENTPELIREMICAEPEGESAKLECTLSP